MPIEVFLLASQLGNSEALVVKKSITKPEDLIGKRIAVPFISTTHYSLLAALKHWGIKPGGADHQPATSGDYCRPAAWRRSIRLGARRQRTGKEGTVLTDSEKWGSGARQPLMSGWYVDFAEKHPEVVKAFAKSAIDAQQPYISNPDEWLKQPTNRRNSHV